MTPSGGGRLSPMPNSPRAGQPAQPEDLVDVDALLAAYHDRHPDPTIPAERVAFGTSGHRGSSLSTTFNDDHIAATSQAIVEYRAAQGTDGPAVHRPRHPRAVRARLGHRVRGVPGQRRARARGLRRRLHAHPRRLDGDHRRQPRPHRRARRRRRHHAEPQPAPRRRLQVQPAARRPGRHRRHELDRQPRQRAAVRQARRGPAAPARPRRAGPVRLPRRVRERPAQRRRPRRDPVGGRADRRGPAGRGERGLLGAPSPSATRST